jgi:hypothetical protein
LDNASDSYFTTSKERDASLPTPELFIKTEALDDGYLLHLASNNFVVRADHLGSDTL